MCYCKVFLSCYVRAAAADIVLISEFLGNQKEDREKSQEMDTWHYWETLFCYAREACISCYPRGSIWQINLSFLLLKHIHCSSLPCPLKQCPSPMTAAAGQSTRCHAIGTQSSLVSQPEGKRGRHISRGLLDVSRRVMSRVLPCSADRQVSSNRSAHASCNDGVCALMKRRPPEIMGPEAGPPRPRTRPKAILYI